MTQILTTQVSFGKFIIGSLYKYLKQDFYKSLENNLTNYVKALKIQGEVRISLLTLLLLLFFFFLSTSFLRTLPSFLLHLPQETLGQSSLQGVVCLKYLTPGITRFSYSSCGASFLWLAKNWKLQKSFLSRVSILEDRREFFTSNWDYKWHSILEPHFWLM